MPRSLAYQKEFAFNAICPYYTMFPLEFPLRLIRKHWKEEAVILDPFCGRGTTIYAARKLGLPSYGLDTSPIAAAIAQAKLASASLSEVMELGETLLAKRPLRVPDTPFFRRAFSTKTLIEICSLREGLLAQECLSNASVILTAAVLGCLHGPLLTADGIPSYFSNQMPRTFSTKPDYSLRFWQRRDLYPPAASVMEVIKKKLSRIGDLDSTSHGSFWNVKCLDARKPGSFRNLPKTSVTITSPPYYGMRTYVQDQWLRMWFMGGAEEIDYEASEQLSHHSHDGFVADLANVWKNVRTHSSKDGHLYIRFGTLPSVKCDPRELLKKSLVEAGGWALVSVRNARNSRSGKRQADHMGRESAPVDEYDFHAVVN